MLEDLEGGQLEVDPRQGVAAQLLEGRHQLPPPRPLARLMVVVFCAYLVGVVFCGSLVVVIFYGSLGGGILW